MLHLGSIQTITNEAGTVEQAYHYDAWGKYARWKVFYYRPDASGWAVKKLSGHPDTSGRQCNEYGTINKRKATISYVVLSIVEVSEILTS